MPDGTLNMPNGALTIAFLSYGQVQEYGNYDAARIALGVDVIRDPSNFREHWPDFQDGYREIGHA